MVNNLNVNDFKRFPGFLKFFHVFTHFIIVSYFLSIIDVINGLVKGDIVATYYIILVANAIAIYFLLKLSNSIYEGNAKSPELTKYYILIVAFVRLVEEIVYYLVLDTSLNRALGTIIFAVVFYLYINKSKRVEIYYKQFSP